MARRWHNDDRNKLIGARLRAARVRLGLSQMRVAEQLGISYQQINKYETGRNVLTCLALLELAAVLQVKASWLLSEPDDGAVAATHTAGPDKLEGRLLVAFSRIASDYRRVVAVHAVEALASVADGQEFAAAVGAA